MQKFMVTWVVLIFFASSIIAQLPKTDIYLAEFKNLNNQPQMVSLKYLNAFNPNGYNNQPRFFTYDEIYFTVAIDTQQNTDIYHLDIKTNQKYIVTDTEKISEFSPSPIPKSDFFSCVRIEADGIDQSLWKYPVDRSDHGQRLFPMLKNVGYYTWLNRDSVVLFLVGSPHKLVLGNVKTGQTEILAENIGRCLKTDGNGNILFVHKVSMDDWVLKSYLIQNKNISSICRMPTGREDFDVMINGNLVVGDGPYLKNYMPSKDKDWICIADLSPKGIKNINRLSVVRDRIVFVNTK